MATVGIILLAPTLCEMGTIEAICTTGMSPESSMALASVAPQRVQVPQVEVRIAAVTSPSLRSRSIASPILTLLSTFVPIPHVVKK